MKLLKKWAFLPMAVLMGLSMVAFAACSSSNEGEGSGNNQEEEETEDPPAEGETAYVFEAEYTEVVGLQGFGPSGSPSGLGLIAESASASNGFYVGSLGTESPITFKIQSDSAVTVTLKGVFGSNMLSSCTWNPETFKITVNGTEMNYKEFTTLDGSSDNPQNFKTKTLGEINLVAGENTIVLVAGENKYLQNLPSAPSIDCLKITTSAKLTMEEHTSNLE